jgi:transposase InsO family protein
MHHALLLVARSIALLERYWRSMKEEYANGFSLFRPLASIQPDLAAYVEWYSSERPHQSLGGRTPDEATALRKVDPPLLS